MTNKSDNGGSHQTLVIDLVESILRYADNPGKCAEYITSQIRELIGVRLVALVSVAEGRRYSLEGICPPRKEVDWNKPEIQDFVASVMSYDTPSMADPATDSVAKSLPAVGIGKSFIVPLMVGKEKVGMLLLLDLLDEGGDLKSILTALNRAAGVLALILKNSLLYKSLEDRVDERTEQLRVKNGELEQSEERLDQLAAQSRTITWEVNSEGLYTFVSHVSEAVIGYAPEELMGKKHFYDIHPEEGREEFKKAAFEDFEQKAIFKDLPNPIQAKDNSLIWVSTTGFPLLDSEGNLKGYRGSDTDITERKKAEEAIRISEEKFSKVFIACPSLITIASMDDGRYIDVNDIFFTTTGYQRDEVIGRTSSELGFWVEPEDRQNFLDDLNKNGFLKNKEIKYRMRNNEVRDFLVSSEIIEIGGKRCSLNFIQDITERKGAVKEIERFALRQRSILDNLPMMAWLKSAEGSLEMVNEPFANAAGLTIEECVGKTDLDIWPDKEKAKAYMDNDREVCATGKKKFVEEPISTPEGTRWFLTYKTPLFDEHGEVTGTAGIAQDITDRKVGEEVLRQSEETFRAVAELSPMAIYSSTGSDQKAKYINNAFHKIFGYSMEDVPTVGDWWVKAYPDEKYRQQVIDQWTYNIEQANKNSTDVEALECVCTCKDGSEKIIVWVGKTIGEDFWAFGYDYTDRKKAEEEKHLFERQLQHTQKLESLGVLSGGIAHDFNNIMAIIMGYCALTKMNYETAEKNIPEIEKAAERAAGLCRQMLSYAGKAQLTRTQVNMRMMVEEMLTMLKATIPQNAVIRADLPSDIPAIEGDASQLRQVIMNLVINASEAIGTVQGEVRVSLTNIMVFAGKLYEDYHGKPIPPREYVCLEVTDNGCGMDDATKWRIFEPFYTTKFTGRGLGMSAVLGIINSHNGALQLFSRLGEGTTFKVYLPSKTGATTENENPEPSVPSAPWKGSGTILLAEDEDQVRFVAKTLLEMFGFSVIAAVNGKEALDLYRENRHAITLVFTDIGMPVMDGYSLFYELKMLDPKLPIIISSGFGDTEVNSRISGENIAGIISKPYNPGQLLEVVKRALESE